MNVVYFSEIIDAFPGNVTYIVYYIYIYNYVYIYIIDTTCPQDTKVRERREETKLASTLA